MHPRTRLVIGTVAASLFGVLAVSAAPLSDIDGNPHKEAIEYLQQKGIVSGYPDGSFHPDDTVNRAELLKILVGSLDIQPASEKYKDCFPDVTTQWFAPFVCFAKDKGWVSGYPDGTFQAGKTVNAAESIKMTVIALGYELTSSTGASLYSDVDPGAWYAPYVRAASAAGILPGSAVLGIADYETRGAVSEILYQAVLREEHHAADASAALESSSSSATFVPRHRNGEAIDQPPGSGDSLSRFTAVVKPAITFDPVTKKYGDPEFIIKATSNSKGQFTYTSGSPFVATIAGNIVTIHSAGVSVITAIQDEYDTFGIGVATMNLTVERIQPTIVFDLIYKNINDGPFTLAPTSNSNGLFTFTTSGSSVTVQDGTATIKGAGITTVTASQEAYGNYAAASKSTTIVVSP